MSSPYGWLSNTLMYIIHAHTDTSIEQKLNTVSYLMTTKEDEFWQTSNCGSGRAVGGWLWHHGGVQ